MIKKFTIRFKGRGVTTFTLRQRINDKDKRRHEEIGKVELHPKFDGKQMIMVIQPL